MQSIINIIFPLFLFLSPIVADQTTTISNAASYGTWQGWGVSLAWWAAKFGTRDDLADIFFTTKSTTFNGVSVPGLGFNVVRYNAGACSWNTVSGSTMVASPKITSSRQISGFWKDWNSADPTCKSVASNSDAMICNEIHRSSKFLTSMTFVLIF